MTLTYRLLLSLSLFVALIAWLPVVAVAQSNPVVSGNARFTVITPNCIRIEYSTSGKFVDARSLFAVQRAKLWNGFTLTHTGISETIDTGAIRLTYTPNNMPLSASNLTASIRSDGGSLHWKPGDMNAGNLGGTITTLDQVSGPVDLGQGVLSRDGWYVLDDTWTPLLTNDWVRSRPVDTGTDWYLFGYGSDYRAALKSLSAIGGPVPLPRRYALGAWYSRYWPYSSKDYRQIVEEYTQHDFPLDNIVMDMDWHKDGWTGWSWNRKLLPDAEYLLQWFHRQGLHVTLNLHPADGVGPQEDRYADFMRDMGRSPRTKIRLPYDTADKKYMNTLFADVLSPLERQGVDFWWVDWQQYVYTKAVPDLTNLFWLNTLFSAHTGQHGQRGLSFSRWAGWGDHRHPIHFSGDATTGWPTLAFEVPFTSTAGNVGCFFWSHDIGGHFGRRNEEAYARWVQFGATSAALRSHSSRDANLDRRPWAYPRWAEDSMRISFHLRSQLFPYIYTSAWESCRDTVPLTRPLYIDYPREEQAYHNAQEYLLGDNLLVAPIVSPGIGPGRVGTQTVWFPQGTWFNVFTGERLDGNSDALVASDINEFPLYARGGVPVPMQPYAPRMATTPIKRLVVRCYPGKDWKIGMSTLYEDDGVTTSYQTGASATSQLSYMRTGDAVTVRISPTRGVFTGQPRRRQYVIELPDTERAVSATCAGSRVTISYDVGGSTNRIAVPSRPVNKPTVVIVHVHPADYKRLSERAMARRLKGVVGVSAPNLKAALARPHLSDDQRAALLTVVGVGSVVKNEGAYLYKGHVRQLFYAPKGIVDADSLTLTNPGSPNSMSRYLTGVPMDVSGPAYLRRGVEVLRPSAVAFTIDGKPFHLTSGSVNDLLGEDNIAATASLTPSGVEYGYSAEGAVDGVVGGWPDAAQNEWSAGSTVGAGLRLDWATPQTVSRIVLYDRPNMTDQVTSSVITFSDRTSIPVGPLPDDASRPLEVKFPSRTITWLTWTATGVKTGTRNAGLSEIAVFAK